ncbi:LysR family transcriptional regulator [Marinomonas rhizomae]|uniref:DNA-binding transcriptional LysR family regulator n=1 Tax=Marinomonas rhizomae TaxID=491948 RepID=A0A366IWC7_9GAMM|nr:LysR substrate-binding domain-containing protein [Marinomonas rhizomae]RBP78018.1 DNA-binding transcriptional LysR family regulator [Marinomonas rhizomae]RNF69255.1 LysR family transcriptional regulator [Marinomonas rhizomae]
MLPPLKSLPVFEAVARLNSFSLAASELNVSQSAVSHQIRILENHLGESLFHRQGRNLELTKEGRHYLDSISNSLLQIEEATNYIKGQQKTHIRLAVYSSFAVYWLIPRLPELKHLHPNLELSIEMSHGTPDLSDRTADFFITTEKEKRGFLFESLYQEELFPVCSQNYLETIKNKLGAITYQELTDKLSSTPSLLAQFPLITSYSIYDRHIEDWKRWFANVAIALPEHIQFHRFSHLMLAYEAAKHSLGIALVNDYMMSEKHDETTLVKLPCSAFKTGDNFYITYKESRKDEEAIRYLRRWLKEEAKSLAKI